MKIGNYDQAIKTGNQKLVGIIQSEYEKYCDWVRQNIFYFSLDPAHQFVTPPDLLNPFLPRLAFSSWGVRAGSPSHGKNLAVDISRSDTSKDIYRIHIGLFGLWLCQFNAGRYHCAISLHNAHIHIDLLPERIGKNTVECKEAYDPAKSLNWVDDMSQSIIPREVQEQIGKVRYYFKNLYTPENIEKVYKNYWFDRIELGYLLPLHLGKKITNSIYEAYKNKASDVISSGTNSIKSMLLKIAGFFLLLNVFKSFGGKK